MSELPRLISDHAVPCAVLQVGLQCACAKSGRSIIREQNRIQLANRRATFQRVSCEVLYTWPGQQNTENETAMTNLIAETVVARSSYTAVCLSSVAFVNYRNILSQFRDRIRSSPALHWFVVCEPIAM